MSSLFSTYNPSILAIPAYHILTLLPHAYALHLATGDSPTNWDNRNPRSSTLKSHLASTLSAETFARFERAEACTANGFENLPIFTTAVVLGNMAGFKRDGVWGMTGFAGAYLGIRALYEVVYVSHTTQRWTVVRTGLWAMGTALCMRVIVKAAKVIGGSGIGVGY